MMNGEAPELIIPKSATEIKMYLRHRMDDLDALKYALDDFLSDLLPEGMSSRTTAERPEEREKQIKEDDFFTPNC